MSLIPNPEYDKPGYCAKCHKAIAEFNGDQKIVRLLGDADWAEFRLDDNSLMRVTLCRECKTNLQPEDTPSIMESVYKGWKFEIEHYLKWDDEKKRKHLDRYAQRLIVGREDKHWTRETIEKSVKEKAPDFASTKSRNKGKI